MDNTIEEINKKYGFDGSTPGQDVEDTRSAQEILDARASEFEHYLRERTSGPIDPARAVMEERVNLAGPEHGGLNFERYYNKSAGHKLGFSPYRNNEEYYNENSSSWDDLGDAWSQAGNLFNLGFGSMWNGKSDREEAEAYARYSNIGTTSRDGIAGDLTNGMLNSGYTIGLLSEIAAEEVGLAVGAALTGGGSAPVLAARSAYNAKKVLSLGSRLKKTLKRIKDLRNVASAKTFWEGAKGVGNALNPVRGGTDYLMNQRALDAADGVSSLAQTGRTFGAFYRDIRELNLAYDEAQLESGFISNGVKDDLIREHIDKEGEYPSSEDMTRINKEAKDAGTRGKAVNTFLIYGTNRISFGNTFNKWMPSRLRKNVIDVAGGKIMKDLGTKKLKGIAGGGLLNYKLAINSIKYSRKNLNKVPLKFIKGVGKYSRANVGEGVQEYFQEVIQDAETTMAKDRYTGAVAGGAWYNALNTDEYFEQYGKSVDKYVSEEGWDVFKGGFIMGLFAGPFGRFTGGLTSEIDKHGKSVFNPNKRKEKDEENLKRFNAEIDRFNSLTDTKQEFLFNYIEMMQRQASYAAKMEDDLDTGDRKSFETNKDHSLVEQILFAQRMGAEDLIIEKLKDLSSMSEKDLKDAFSREKGEVQDLQGKDLTERDATDLAQSYKQTAEKSIARAEEIIKFSTAFDKLFPEPIGGGAMDSDFGDPRGQRSYLKSAWQAAKVVAITNQYDFVRSMERAQSILNKVSTKPPFWKKDKTPPASDITRIFNGFEMEEHLDIIEDIVASLSGIPDADRTAQNNKDLAYNQEVLNSLSFFISPKGPLQNYVNKQRELAKEDNRAKEIEAAGELEVNSKIRYAFGDSSWGGEIIGEAERASDGAPQWKIKKDDGSTTRLLKSSAGIVVETADVEGATEEMHEATDAMRKAYVDYLSLVAKYYDNPVNKTDFEESFEDFIDFYALKEDTQNLSQVVNTLTNPDAQLALMQQFEELKRAKFENMDETVRTQMEMYAKTIWLNELIQSLAKHHNVYIDKDELIALNADNQIPKKYYNVQTNELLRDTSITYTVVRAVVRKALEEEGLIEPRVRKGHWVKKQANGKFSVVTPEGKVIVGDKTKEEAEALIPDLDAALEEGKEKKPEAPTKKAPVKKLKPITFDTPFEEWTDEKVLTAAKLSLDNYNQAQQDAGGVEIKDLEDYLQTDAARFSVPLNDAIEEYNNSLIEEPVKTTKAGTTPPEEETPEEITATQEEVLSQLDILKQRRAETELTSKGYIYLKKLYQRVSNYIKGSLVYDSKDSVTNIKNSLPVGNFIDEVGRVVFNNSDVTYEEFLSELESVPDEKKTGFAKINTEEYFNSVKDVVLDIKEELIKKHGEKTVFFTDEIFVNNDLAQKIEDEFDGIGGVPDMIVIQENGEAHVYDFKNKIANTAAIANNKIQNKFNKKKDSDLEKWSKQQSAYMDLLAVNGIKISSINAIVFPTQYEREKFTEEFEAWTPEGKEAAVELTEEDKAKIEAFKPTPTPTGTLTTEPFIAELKYKKLIPEDVPVPEEAPTAPTAPKKTGKAFPIATAKPSTLSPGLEEKVFNGEIEFLALPSKSDAQTGVDDFKAAQAGKAITKTDVGEVRVISQEVEAGKKRYVQLTYKGHKAFNELEITDPIAQLDVKGTRDEGNTGPYKNVVTINGTDYYAAVSSMSDWVQGKGKLQIFEVSAPFEKSAETTKDSVEAWANTIESRFNNSTNIKLTLQQVNQDNVMRKANGQPSLSSKEIEDLYNAATGKNVTDIIKEGIEIGDHYTVNPMEIDGKMVNFGTAMVINISDLGITLQSTGVNTQGQTKLVNPKSMKDVVIEKLSKDTDIQADIADSISPEEKKAIEDTNKSTEKFAKDASSIKKKIAEAKTKSKDEVKNNFKKNFGC